MQPGGTLIYSWAADHATVYYDMHGETVVTLKMSGFYELREPKENQK
jgi:hypothetical protein